MKYFIALKDKMIKIFSDNLIEICGSAGVVSLSVGAGMIYKPLFYLAFGAMLLLITFLLYNNQ